MKKNNKGFVLVETLVVTVFVMAVFSVIYINFYPLAGEYERREFYDDIDSKYGAYWMKVFVQRSSFSLNTSLLNSQGYVTFTCNNLTNAEDQSFCNAMWDKLYVNQVIVTNYRIGDDSKSTDFKRKAPTSSALANNPSFLAYISYLPDFVTASLNGAKYRVLVEFKRPNGTLETDDFYYTYSNMEVIK